MARKTKDSDSPFRNVRLDRDVVEKALMVAMRRNLTLAEFLSPILRPTVEKEYTKEVARMSRAEVSR